MNRASAGSDARVELSLDSYAQQGNLRKIGIGEQVVSARPSDILITFGLGSCVAVLLWDVRLRAGGMIHCMLPASQIDPMKAADRPSLYVDTGVKLLLQHMEALGSHDGDLRAKLVGGGALRVMSELFCIGARNIAAAREVLEGAGVPILAEDVGGARSRTVLLQVGTGHVLIKSLGEAYPL